MSLTADQLREIEEMSVPLGQGTPAQSPSAPVDEDALSQSRPAFASAEDRMRAAGRGAVRGLYEMGPIAGGAAAGLKLGTAAAPLLGPAAPLGPPLGALTGAVLGYMGGQRLGEEFAPEETDPQLRPYFEGGRTAGGGIGMAPLGFAMPVMQGGRVSKAISQIGEYARSHPAGYLSREAIASGASGVAGGTAVSLAPDSPGTRMGAEMAAAVLTPGKFIVDLVEGRKALQTGAGTALTTADRIAADRVARFLDTVIRDGGEDPQQIIDALRRNEGILFPPTSAGPRPTPGMKTGSEVLSALERSIARNNQVFASDRGQQAAQTMAAYRALLDRLEASGDPAALKAAAEIQDRYYQDLIQQSIQQAEARTLAAAGRFPRGETPDRAAIGNTFKANIEASLKDAREMERQLWNDAMRQTVALRALPQFKDAAIVTVKTRPQNAKRTFLEIAAEMTPERLGGAEMGMLTSAMRRFGINQSSVNAFKRGRQTPEFLETGKVPVAISDSIPVKNMPVQDLLALRGDLLAQGRSADAAGNADLARIYNNMAGALLDDLSAMPGDAYNAARTFSKRLNDVYTRTFAGELDDTLRTGAQRYTPESLVQRAFSLGTDRAYERLRDVRQSMTFLRREYDQAVSQFGPDSPQAQQLLPYAQAANARYATVRGAQAGMLRLAAAELVDPLTGQFKEAALAGFVNKNRTALRELGLLGELQDAQSAQRALLDAKQGTAATEALRKEEALQALMRNEDPMAAVASVLKGQKPMAGLKNLADMARAAPGATDGLKSVLYQWAAGQGTRIVDGQEVFQPNAYYRALFDPLSKNQPPLATVMQRNGLMTADEAQNLKKLLAPMQRIEDAMSRGALLEVTSPNQGLGAVEELMLSQLGARVAGALSPGGPGSLSFAATTIKATKNLFSRLPARQALEVLEKAAKDPVLMESLLSRNLSSQQDRALALGVLRRLYPFGAMNSAVYRYLDEPDPQEELEVPEPPAPRLRPLPPAPPVRGVPGLPPPQQGAPQGQGQPGQGQPGAPQPNAREMFQRLFPNDTISPMMPRPPMLPGAMPPPQ